MKELPPHIKAVPAMFRDRIDAQTRRMAELQQEAADLEREVAYPQTPSEREVFFGRLMPDVFDAEEYCKLIRDRVAHDAYIDATKRRLS